MKAGRSSMIGRLVLTALALSATRLAAQEDVLYRQVPLYNGAQARLDTMGVVATVAGRPDALFTRLRAAYRQLNVPTDVDDSAHGALGTLRVSRSGTFAGAWLSRIVDCGPSYNGNLADEANVELAVMTFLRPAGSDSTMVRTAVIATARPLSGSQGLTPCSSHGYLEDQLRRRMDAGSRR